ncbi:MAG: TonB-dependent receptor [Dysgonamonadaceae bacterium]|jgi:outer membrane receptor for ferrienterochelin and colicin|nr:TonB-dependent receptor [Dysgonamonadaceae bacterium]
MKKNIIILFLLALALPILAQKTVRGYVFDAINEPLVGATVHCEQTMQGVITNADGFFEINMAEGKTCLTISFIGYVSQTLNDVSNETELKIILQEDATVLDEFVLNQRAMGTVTLRNATLQTQRITTAELNRAACCNLSESFETNASVDVSFSDAATGAKQIRLLGLAGTYVQKMTENIPNFRGVAQPFGMDYIPGSWIESIQVSKGTSSVKNGYEALAGQINVEYKKPQEMDKLFVNLYAGDAGRLEANVDAGIILNENLSTGVFAHVSSNFGEHDKNDDGFLDEPLTRQVNLMNRWHHSSGNYVAQYGARFVNELRESGQFAKHHTIDDPYKISFNTNRGEFFTKQAYILRGGDLPSSVALIASGSVHDQKAMFDRTQYDVNQKNVYLSAMFERTFSHIHSLSTGLSMNYDGFNEMLNTTSYNRSETVSGAYAEYTLHLYHQFVMVAGIRGDYSTQYGFFATPRLHVRYSPAEWVSLRTSVGKGFRTPHVLAENNYLLASSRRINIAENLTQEEAWNTGFNATFHIPVANRELTVSGEFYHTNFINQLVVDVDSDPNMVSFYNLDGGRSFTNSAQIEVSYPLFDGFTLTGAYRYIKAMSDYRNPETGEVRFLSKPLQSDYKALATASYQTPLGKWQFDFTGQFNGGGRMPTPSATNPLWAERFDPYTVFLGQVTKNFRNFSVYLGSENLFDFRQSNPIIDAANPRGDNFDATMIWGPVMGRKVYGGIRWTIPRI